MESTYLVFQISANFWNLQDTEYKCDICGKSFSRPSNVARHVETIHTKTKTFPCKWCGKDFKSTGGRDMHIHADHRGIRFDCNLCGKVFKRKGSLDRHVLGVHQQGVTSMFKCPVCLKEFKQKSHLKTHLKNIHHQDMEGLPTQVPIQNMIFKEETPQQTFQVFSNWITPWCSPVIFLVKDKNIISKINVIYHPCYFKALLLNPFWLFLVCLWKLSWLFLQLFVSLQRCLQLELWTGTRSRLHLHDLPNICRNSILVIFLTPLKFNFRKWKIAEPLWIKVVNICLFFTCEKCPNWMSWRPFDINFAKHWKVNIVISFDKFIYCSLIIRFLLAKLVTRKTKYKKMIIIAQNILKENDLIRFR